MPNPGGIHLGCETCRRRRIKCDRSQPECRRCIKYGASCPGYPREEDVRFRHETTKILKKAGNQPSCILHIKPQQDRKKRSSNLTPFLSGKKRGSGSAGSPIAEWTSTPSFLAGSVNVSWDSVLAQYFFDQTVMPVGWYSYLPLLYHRSPPAGSLRVTVTAAALALGGNQFHDPLMLQRASTAYGVALLNIKNALGHPKRCLEDDTLFAILVLNVLDDFAGSRSFTCCSHHLNGCAELIKLRDSKGFYTELTPHLAHSLVIQTQRQLMQGRRPEVPILKDESFLSWLWAQSIQSPAARLSAHSLELGKIREKVARVLAVGLGGREDNTTRLWTALHDIQRLDKSMLIWHRESDGPRWAPRSITLHDTHGGDERADYYSDVQVSKVWNHWRVARIILHETCIDVVERLQLQSSHEEIYQDLEKMKLRSLNIIDEALSDIFASIPYHMQAIDSVGRRMTSHRQKVLGGNALVWPLNEVIRGRWTPATKKTKALELLQMIGDVLGVKQALAYVEELQGASIIPPAVEI